MWSYFGLKRRVQYLHLGSVTNGNLNSEKKKSITTMLAGLQSIQYKLREMFKRKTIAESAS